MSAVTLLDQLIRQAECSYELYPTEACAKHLDTLHDIRRQHVRFIEQLQRVQQFLPCIPQHVQEELRVTLSDQPTFPIHDERTRPTATSA